MLEPSSVRKIDRAAQKWLSRIEVSEIAETDALSTLRVIEPS
jgi:hypothetical protein